MKNMKNIIIAVLLVVAGGGIVYFLYSNGSEVEPTKAEKVAKRVKVEVPEEEEKVAHEEGKALTKPAETKPAEQKKDEKAVEKKPVPMLEPKKEEKIKVAEKKPTEAKAEQKSKKIIIPEKKIEKKMVREEAAKKEENKKVASMKEEKPAAVKGSWAVHVASYVTKDEAVSMEKKLKDGGYSAYVTEFNLKGKQWYRLRVGFYQSEGEAKGAGKKIEKAYGVARTWHVKPTRKEILSYSH